EWAAAKARYDAGHVDRGNAVASFFTKVVHPPTHFTLLSPDLVEKFGLHLELMDRHLQTLVRSTQQHTALTDQIGGAYLSLASSLDGLARGNDHDVDDELQRVQELSWCWRDCHECHGYSRSLLCASKHMAYAGSHLKQAAAGPLAEFAERSEDYRARMPALHSLSTLHAIAMERAEYAGGVGADGVRSRVETIVNVTAAEMDRVHKEKNQQWRAWLREWVDGQIIAQEKILQALKASRDLLDS
ncbi:hypothetical protein HK101_003869, partial [Irineochytrium annulatum]